MSAFSFPPNSAAWAAARTLCDAVVEPRRTREVGSAREDLMKTNFNLGFGTGSASGYGPAPDLEGIPRGGKRGCKNVREGLVG